MKVILHIATEVAFMDREVQVAVECSAAPRIGDCFHPLERDIDILEKAVIDGGKRLLKAYSSWIYGRKGNRYLSFDDCIFVADALWRANEKGEYEYHICLNSEDKKSSDPPCEKHFLDADYEQILTKK